MKIIDKKIAIVTGANSGLGYETTIALATVGITVIMACRHLQKGESAKKSILQQLPHAQLEVMHIDTSDLRAVKSFAANYLIQYGRLDILVNNAGVMMPPYELTDDGFESQLGTNYLGHFVLTGLLMPLIVNTPGARVVTLSSLAHKWSPIRFGDVNFTQGYNRRKAYGQSKTACLVFAYELDRRCKQQGVDTLSVAAHPGLSNTSLARHLPAYLQWLSPLLGQPPAAGAQSVVYAALSPNLQGGEYVGPGGFKEWRGKPAIVHSTPYACCQEVARQLWTLSEKLTGVSFNLKP